MAWSTVNALHIVTEALWSSLRSKSSDKAQPIKAELGQEDFKAILYHLSVLHIDLTGILRRNKVSPEDPIAEEEFGPLITKFEDVFDDMYIDGFLESNVGRDASKLLVQRVVDLCQTSRTFSIEAAIKPNRADRLRSLLPFLEAINALNDEKLEDGETETFEDTDSASDPPPALHLRQNTEGVKQLINNLHATLHRHWPCQEHQYQARESGNEYTLGSCEKAFVELDSGWLLSNEPMENFFLALEGNGIDQLCEFQYAANKVYTQPDECICQISNEDTQNFCLSLLFDDANRLWYDGNEACGPRDRLYVISNRSQSFDIVSLRTLCSNSKFNFAMAMKVEILVARAVLVLINGPWMPNKHALSLDTIFLSCCRDDGRPHLLDSSLTQVFIPTYFGSVASSFPKSNSHFAPTFPVIKALGFLMADIEGQRLKLSISETSASPVNKAKDILDRIERDNGPGSGIHQAISFCLGNDAVGLYLASGGRNTASLDDPEFLTFLYKNIIRKLEEDYNTRALVSWDEIYQVGKTDASGKSKIRKRTQKQSISRAQRHICAPNPVFERRPGFLETQQPSLHPGGNAAIEINHGLSNGHASTEVAHSFHSAERWFKKLKEVHRVLNISRGRKFNETETPDVNDDELEDLVKVALLDTGVDLGHPYLQDFLVNHQLHAGIDLFDERNQDGVVDLDGHGTHMCHTLLRTAPFTRVYPIRVFMDIQTLHQDEEGKSASLVAKAIRVAVEKWDVDIITMSFTFTNEQAVIEDAMCDIQKTKDVLIFAAASNNTPLNVNPVGYPASYSDLVICVLSSSAEDEKSTFSPNGLVGDFNLSAVGEGIMAAWPRHLKSQNSDQLYKILEGTSSATVIAAGIAALVLDFSRRSDLNFRDEELRKWNRERAKLRRIRDMRKVIWTCMTHQRGECNYNLIIPWMLLKKVDLKDIAWDIMRALKSRPRLGRGLA